MDSIWGADSHIRLMRSEPHVIGGWSTSRAAYEHFRDGFAEAMDSRLYTIDYLDDLMVQGKAHLGWTKDSAVICEMREYPTGARAVHGLFATGKLDEIVNVLIPAAEQWGRENGCAYAFVDSRDAWQRILGDKGFATYKVALMKEL